MEFDYKKINLKSGLEVHQQLDTGKLFCSCPGYLRQDEPDFVVKRKLHAVAGETGKVDDAVKHEASLNKSFIYQAYNDTNCLIELDEEPPHLINENALNETLKISLLLNCEIYPISQIMRKTVIDGSNTSGFQRTVLIGHSGFLETSSGRIKIDGVALEEDSARLISDKQGDEVIYRLDRLGIPLVEIATAPDLNNPEQIKEAALKIGEILRACKVKRGIGTIRQDINMSIKGHERVEIKGFQDTAMMILTINKEIERQLNNLGESDKIGQVRVAQLDGSTKFLRPLPGKARMYPETDIPILKLGRDRINVIKKQLPKLKHEIKDELKKKGLSEELTNLVLEHLNEFEVLLKVYEKDTNLVAKMVTLWRNEFASKLKKNFNEIKEILNENILEQVLEALKFGKISEGDVKGVLWKVVSGNSIEEAMKIERISDDKLEEGISKIVKENSGLREGAYMGLIISKLGKDIDKRKAMEIVQKLIKDF